MKSLLLFFALFATSSSFAGLVLQPFYEGTYMARFSCQEGSEYSFCRNYQAYTLDNTPLRLMVYNHADSTTFVIVHKDDRAPMYHFTAQNYGTGAEIFARSSTSFERRTPEMTIEFQTTKGSENLATAWIRDSFFPADMRVELKQTFSANYLPTRHATWRAATISQLVGDYDGMIEGPSLKATHVLRIRRSAIDPAGFVVSAFPSPPRSDFPILEFTSIAVDESTSTLFVSAPFDFVKGLVPGTHESTKLILLGTEDSQGGIYLNGHQFFSNGLGYFKANFKHR